jgi:predicted transposase YbfD/YdcC
MLTTQEFMKGFEEQFEDVNDPRQAGKIIYPMIEILFLAVVAVAGKAEDWEDIEDFGEAHLEVLREYLPFKEGTPSNDTIRRFFGSIDPKEMNKVLIKVFGSKDKENTEDANIDRHYAIDGKTLRGSRFKDTSAFHFLNVYAAHSGLTLYGKVIDEKKNEISALPEAIESLDLEGAIVSIDAMGCQKEIAKQVTDKKADYIFGLKLNHACFYYEIEKAFATDAVNFFNMDLAETFDKGHGRQETRKCRVIRDVEKIKGYKEWARLKAIIEVKRSVVEKGKVTESINYYISSSSSSAGSILKSIRSHWGVESMHWLMDVVFGEDASKVRLENGPANMAIVRRFVLNVLNKIKEKRQTRPKLMNSIGWSPHYLRKFIDALIT